jgi:serine phosphatase RsbU (regulator of sigma subunit)
MYSALGKKHSNKRINDGMDIALLSLDMDSLLLNYSGANRPLYIVRQGQIIELGANKMSIGESDSTPAFGNKIFQTKKNDMLYLFSDGYADQFGGEKGKKFTTKRFKELITSIAGSDTDTQKERLKNSLNEWMREEEQTDDICVIGVKI